MAAGLLHNVVVCTPAPSGTQGVCPPGAVEQVVSAYLIDPLAVSYIDAVAAPYDYTAGAAIWGTVFTFTLSLYFVSHSIGVILGKIRRG